MYEMKKLGYEYNALEPYIDTLTIDLHYNKHYGNYVNNFNKIVPDYYGSIFDIIKNIDNYPLDKRDDILFNAGGIINHELYFSILSENNNEPYGEFKDAIDKQYGSYDKFKTSFINTANKLVGSGWTFLILDQNNKFNIINTSNQDTPYFYDFIPIIGLDLWEHAYYLKYKNERAKYIDAFFNILDYKVVNEIYKQALQQKTL